MKKYLVIFAILIILFLSGCTTQEQTDDQDNNEFEQDNNDENAVETEWVKETDIIFPDTTSVSSIVLENGKVRTYIMDEYSGISYAESTDGKTFSSYVRTNIDTNLHPTNPAITYIDNSYLLFFNVMEENDKYLYRAESLDGISFTSVSKVAGPDSDYSQPVDVPDIVILSDGSLRIYCTQPHDGINTAVSSDLGKTWTTDGQNLVDSGACDPDVYLDDDFFIMYYTMTVLPDEAEGMSKEEIKSKGLEENYIQIAKSSDGVNWDVNKEDIISPKPEITSNGCVFDADYVVLPDGTEIIYFSQATGQNKDSGIINVYRAIKTKIS